MNPRAEMMQIEVLRNSQSSKNLAGKSKPYPAAISSVELKSLDDLPNLLKKLMASKPDCIIIDGGDGTVREVLTHLPAICGNKMPMIGIIANGNSNLIARNAGFIKSPDALLKLAEFSVEQLEAMAHPTPLLRLVFDDKSRPPLRGFMMGWGAYSNATELAQQETNKKGAFLILAILFKVIKTIMFESRDRGLRKGSLMSMKIDGQTYQQGARFIGLATTLRGPLSAGLNPFWGEGEGAIRWTDILAPAPRFLISVLCAVSGRPTKWMTRHGYLSGKANSIELSLKSPLVLDGEIFSFDDKQSITLSADENVRFISMG